MPIEFSEGVKECSVDGCSETSWCRGWCNPHYQRWKRYGEPTAGGEFRRSGDRFWNKVDKSGDCWLWTAFKDKRGYGQFSLDGKLLYAHRHSYTLANPDEDLTGMSIDHQCHNSSCVNPEHLRAVTHKQNLEHRVGANSNNKSSGVRGVCWNKSKNKWQAIVTHNGKAVYVGLFDVLAEAAEAVRIKRLELFSHSDMDRTA
jgi:hypothetical protein